MCYNVTTMLSPFDEIPQARSKGGEEEVTPEEAEQEQLLVKPQCDPQYVDNRKSLSPEAKKLRNSLLWGIIGGVALATWWLIEGITKEQPAWQIVIMALLGAYGGYAVLTQLIWANSVWSVFFFFLRAFGLVALVFKPGVASSMFLIKIFVILGKLVGIVLCLAIAVVVFIIGLVVTLIYAMVIFPFALASEIKYAKQSH